MLPGHAADPATGAEREIILSDVKEAMGRYKAGRITEEQFYEIECKACGGPGMRELSIPAAMLVGMGLANRSP
jgi:dihydroxy-acid dehydratase